MARFRAYSDTDSSDDEQEQPQNAVATRASPPKDDEAPAAEGSSKDHDDDDDEEEEEISEEEENNSDEDIDEVSWKGRVRARPRKALVEDANGDMVLDGDSGDEDTDSSEPSSSRSSSPERGTMGDPNIIPWARTLGVDAQKMHVMQTSLFRMPEETAALKALNDEPEERQTQLRLGFPNTLNRKHSRDSEDDGLRHDSRERQSFAHHLNLDQNMFRPSRKYARVEINSSIAQGKEGGYVDAGLAFGRSFRVGWGPGGKLVHSGTICGPFSSASSANSSVITVTKTPFPAAQAESEENSPSSVAKKLLKQHLEHTPIRLDESGVPFAHIEPHTTSLNFNAFASLFPTTDAVDPAPLFRLGSALFDPIDLRLNARNRPSHAIPGSTVITPDVRNRITMLRRRVALSKWFETVASSAVEGDGRAKSDGSLPPPPVETIYNKLTGHQISEACEVAMSNGYMRLATLISQAGGDDVFKADIQTQLEIWRQESLAPPSGPASTDNVALISKGIWRVYQLLGGLPLDQHNDAAHAQWVEDVCSGLDWKRILGLYLWYGTGVDAPVAQAVHLYEGLTRRYGPSLVARPLPKWQIEAAASLAAPSTIAPGSRNTMALLGSTSQLAGTTPSPQSPQDPLFSLIQLYADPTMSLAQALNPLSFGPDERWGGISMCWHLYMILSRSMRVRDFPDRQSATSTANGLTNGMSDGELNGLSANGHSSTADLLASSYAFELESWGMIQDAMFVLLHIESSQGREKALKDLLSRSVASMEPCVSARIVESLQIPQVWVNEAKAIRALDQGNSYEACKLYFSAELYNASHDLAVLELAPDAILHRDFKLLKELFEPFEVEGRKDKIEGWFVRGKILLDYANIMTRLPKLQAQVDGYVDAQGDFMTVPSIVEEIDELVRKVPKTIALSPDIFHRSRSSDDRHAAVIEEMTQGLLAVMGKTRPGMLLQQPILNCMDGATKIRLIRGKGYARFLQNVDGP